MTDETITETITEEEITEPAADNGDGPKPRDRRAIRQPAKCPTGYGWYDVAKRIGWIATPCSKCPCDKEICQLRREDARYCEAAHKRMRRIWTLGIAKLKKSPLHCPSLEMAAMWAAIQLRRGLERCQAIKNNQSSEAEIRKMYEYEHDAYKKYANAWRECGLSANRGLSKGEGFDSSVYG